MCYVVPVTAAVITTLYWRKNKSVDVFWLMLMFYGSGIFGVIDHLWNGELFLISGNWVKDLSLGAVITAATFLVWKAIVFIAKRNFSVNAYMAASPKEKFNT